MLTCCTCSWSTSLRVFSVWWKAAGRT